MIKDFEMNDWVSWEGDLQLRVLLPGPPKKSRALISDQQQGIRAWSLLQGKLFADGTLDGLWDEEGS